MLVQSIEANNSLREKISVTVIAGLAFASALGLSVWVTLLFAVFWAIWMLVKFFDKKNLQQIGLMALVGVVALLAAAPFMLDLMQGGEAVLHHLQRYLCHLSSGNSIQSWVL